MAADGVYKIYQADPSADLTDPASWSFSGTTNTGSIGAAFDTAASMASADPAHVFSPFVQYEVRRWDEQLQSNEPADPAINSNDPAIAANLFACAVGGQDANGDWVAGNRRWQDYLAGLPDGTDYSVQAVGPG